MEIRNDTFLEARSIRREVLRPCGPDSEVVYPGKRFAQGRGVGGRLLQYGVERVLQHSASLVWCYGRSSARTFYERHGFHVEGDEFALPHSGPHFLFVRRAG